MRRLRHRISFGMCVLLLLGSIGTGLARGQSPAVGLTTLCIASITVTVAVDARGQPITGGHVCPDCLGLALAAVPGAGAPLKAPAPALLRLRPQHEIPVSRTALVPPARAPPGRV